MCSMAVIPQFPPLSNIRLSVDKIATASSLTLAGSGRRYFLEGHVQITRLAGRIDRGRSARF